MSLFHFHSTFSTTRHQTPFVFVPLRPHATMLMLCKTAIDEPTASASADPTLHSYYAPPRPYRLKDDLQSFFLISCFSLALSLLLWPGSGNAQMTLQLLDPAQANRTYALWYRCVPSLSCLHYHSPLMIFKLLLCSECTILIYVRCSLDGSPAGFYFRKASSDVSARKWLVFMEGGGYCLPNPPTANIQPCAERLGVRVALSFNRMHLTQFHRRAMGPRKVGLQLVTVHLCNELTQ
jgi:hypothetical protein